MSSYAGPAVSTNSLIFGYDMANTQKSWLGKPTNNLIMTVPLVVGQYAYASNPVFTDLVPDSLNNPRTVRRYTINAVINSARAAFSTPIVVGSTYTFSCMIKYYGANAPVPSFMADASKGSPEAGAGNTFTGVTTTFTLVANGWYALQYTFTVATSINLGSILVYGVVTGTDTAYLNQIFDVYNEQFELSDIATPYSSGIRSNTQSIIDISSSNNIITLPSLTYNSDNTFSFNGTSNYIDCGVLPQIGSSLTGLTVEVWVYSTSASVRCIIENGTNYNVNTFYMFQENSTQFTFTVMGPASYSVVFSNFSYAVNTWYHLVGVWTPGLSNKMYANGVDCSGTLGGSPQTTLINGNTNILVGARAGVSYQYAGKIPLVKLYSRSLSAAEVQQNFNAIRGRYGL